jgi:hypothetical protein
MSSNIIVTCNRCLYQLVEKNFDKHTKSLGCNRSVNPRWTSDTVLGYDITPLDCITRNMSTPELLVDCSKCNKSIKRKHLDKHRLLECCSTIMIGGGAFRSTSVVCEKCGCTVTSKSLLQHQRSLWCKNYKPEYAEIARNYSAEHLTSCDGVGSLSI